MGTALVFYVFFVETCWLKYEQTRVPVDKPLPPGGLSILHLSDIHFKKWEPRKLRIFRSLEKRVYDLILITGDIIDDHRGTENALKALSHLRSRHGTYCIFGNHEYLDYKWFHMFRIILGRKIFPPRRNPRLNELKNGLGKIGIHHLGNRNCRLDRLGITLIGLDDFVAGMCRMERATQHLSSSTFNILLTHHPDSLLAANPKKFDLALCGHTHGGQIRLPFIGPLFTDSKLPKSQASGWTKINGITTYISRGFSSSRHASPRLLCRPEMTEILLVPKGALLSDIPRAPGSSQRPQS